MWISGSGSFHCQSFDRGRDNSEITYAAYGGIGLALATTKDPAVAVTLAIFNWPKHLD